MPPTRFIPPAPLSIRPSGFVRPSGSTPDRNTIMRLQSALYALGHIPADGITSAMPIATRAQLLAFQQNYNAENRCRRREAGAPCQPGRVYGNPYQPARIAEDGDWGPNTQAALTNYLPFAESAIRQQASQQAPRPSTTPDVMGWGGAPGPDESIGPLKNPRTTTPSPSPQSSTPAVRPEPAPSPAPPPPPASTFPTGPVIAGVVGLAVIAAAVAYKRSRKGR